ncbi:MAG: CpsD/CapB family tyrosine-protein kinase [Actinomycetota bacterium]
MSKFFNETHKLAHAGRGPRVVKPELDVQDLVGTLKKNLDSPARPSSHPGDLNPKPLLSSRVGEELAPQVAATRLQNAALVRLPRGDGKSFLSRQYNADLQAAVEAYRTLRTRLLKQQSKHGMRSMAVSSTAQGEGKTLTTLNLALCYSAIQDRSVLLIDSDLRTKGLSTLLGLHQFAGLGDILEKGIPCESAIVRTDYSNLYILPAGTSAVPPAELFSKPEWKEFLAWSSETFQMTLADSPPVLDLADTELIISVCESLLLITRSGKTRRQALSDALDHVDRKKLVGVVFNDCRQAAARSYYKYSHSGRAQSAEPLVPESNG